jgi:hypothetical protein
MRCATASVLAAMLIYQLSASVGLLFLFGRRIGIDVLIGVSTTPAIAEMIP